MRPALAALLALALLAAPAAAQPAPLAVEAARAPGGALVVTWSPPAGQQLACITRERGAIIGCVGPGVGRIAYGPGSIDIALRVEPGELVGVCVWDAEGLPLARGWGRLGSRVRLPLVAR